MSMRSIYFTFFTTQAAKLAQRAGKQGDEIAGYSNTDNRFGDSALTDRHGLHFDHETLFNLFAYLYDFYIRRFVWRKKIEKQIIEGVDVKELGVEADRRRQEERLVRPEYSP